ncbi:MAG TPA: glucose-6-phosphate isomerase [Ignavibacteria bacterium]|nr:glucose-6-phosphate isomerase [Ignavibacteria bacterium]
MDFIKVNKEYISSFFSDDELRKVQAEVFNADNSLTYGTGKGSDFHGWMDLPARISESEINDIKYCAENLRSISSAVVVIGIGGSYLGARAVIEALSPSFKNKFEKGNPDILYAGHNLSEEYLHELLSLLSGIDYSIIVISKSGTTIEPAVAFRLLKNHIETKYGKDEARKRIVAVTDKSKGALKKLADEEGYKTFVIPDNVGGRFSVLTPVGLLPVACAGIDISGLLQGAKDILNHINKEKDFFNNPACLYAGLRNILYRSWKEIEIMVSYEPKLGYLIEWWKQLYGESEGKQRKGLFPVGVNFTTDLHSLGQIIQDGKKNFFETVLWVDRTNAEIKIPEAQNDPDGLNYLSDKRISYINEKAMLGTVQAHTQGSVPNILIKIPELNAYYIGQLIYFFERACGISGYMLGVNPFDQPGVEAYKKEMKKLL